MFKKRSIIPGHTPATLSPVIAEEKRRAPTIRLIEYDESSFQDRIISSIEEVFGCLDNGKVSWINIDGLGDIDLLQKIGDHFKLHPLALEDVLHVGQRPKVEHYDGYIFIVTEMLSLNEEGKMEGEQVSIFLGPNFLITIQEEELRDVFDPVRTRIKNARGFIRKAKNDYLAYALLDCVIDHYFPVLEAIGAAVEDLENQVVDRPSATCMRTLHAHKRTLMQMRRYAWPTRDLVSSLLHEESGIFDPRTKIFLRDCYDHTVQIMDLIESYRDVVSGLMELYLSAIGIRTNEIMRVLTVISSIFIPLTFIAGLYGMNFASEVDGKVLPLNMPELHHPYGYVGVLAVMAIIAVVQIAFFKKKNWL